MESPFLPVKPRMCTGGKSVRLEVSRSRSNLTEFSTSLLPGVRRGARSTVLQEDSSDRVRLVRVRNPADLPELGHRAKNASRTRFEARVEDLPLPPVAGAGGDYPGLSVWQEWDGAGAMPWRDERAREARWTNDPYRQDPIAHLAPRPGMSKL